MVCKGIPFPFWMRGQAVLTLRVVSADPDDVVRLAPGAEVSIAPRPRLRAHKASNDPMSLPTSTKEDPNLPPAWFRIQVFSQPSHAGLSSKLSAHAMFYGLCIGKITETGRHLWCCSSEPLLRGECCIPVGS